MAERTAERTPPRWARGYIRIEREADTRGQRERRLRLLRGLSGRVLELGAGHGPNFAHYPPEVSEIVAIEPEWMLRERAEKAAASAPVPIRVVDADAGDLPGSDGEFDAVVCSLVLCSVPDQATALAELARVLRPGGELRYYEHVVSERRAVAVVEHVADLAWPHFAGGCHMSRDTERALQEAGFEIAESDRFGFSPAPPMPAVSHVLGTAIKA